MDIKNKAIVITGAASGLGEATATYLSNLGAKIFRLDKNKISDDIIECDITDENNLKKTIDSFDAIHAVVHCAGISHAKRLIGKNGAMALSEFQKIIQINLIGTFNMMKFSAEKMSKQNIISQNGERGVIINTASVAAFEGQVGQIAYSASKGALVSMTLPAARELAQFGIRVMTIAPGIMQTPMMTAMSQTIQKELSNAVLFPKKLGNPTNFAELVAHIIQNDYLNGSTIRLDGGLRLS